MVLGGKLENYIIEMRSRDTGKNDETRDEYETKTNWNVAVTYLYANLYFYTMKY